MDVYPMKMYHPRLEEQVDDLGVDNGIKPILFLG